MPLRLISVSRSTNPDKKYMAVFDRDGRSVTTHFGAKGYTDHTMGASEDQRQNYIRRHTNSREDFSDPTTAASLSRYILWGESTSFAENLRAFKRRFSL
jgi:hypothetical protein